VKEDNGLVLYAWPKSIYESAVVQTQVEACMKHMGGIQKALIKFDD
jgi:hypothetical protein